MGDNLKEVVEIHGVSDKTQWFLSATSLLEALQGESIKELK